MSSNFPCRIFSVWMFSAAFMLNQYKYQHVVYNLHWYSSTNRLQNSLTHVNSPPKSVFTVITSVPIYFSCSNENLTDTSGGIFTWCEKYHIFLTFISITTRAYINCLIDISSKNHKSIWKYCPGLRLSVFFVIPLGKFVILTYQHIMHLFCLQIAFCLLFRHIQHTFSFAV